MIKIDGRFGEGGGQILRTSLTLSVLTGQPVQINHIRANRRNPGLAPQHLTNVKALAAISHAHVTGDTLGAQSITFHPQQPPLPGHYHFDVSHVTKGGSAGSVSLILQTILLPLAMAAEPSTVTLAGGTHVAWSPSFHYLANVYLPFMTLIGIETAVTLKQYGFYPKGGGLIQADIPGNGRLLSVTIPHRGGLQAITGSALAANLPAHIAQRMANRAYNVLRPIIAAQITPQRVNSAGPGAGIFLLAQYDSALAGFTALGKKGLPADKVADAACEALLTHHKRPGAVDPFLADQIMLPLALANGQSLYTTTAVTQHLLTNAHIIRQFLPKPIHIVGELGQPGTVTIG